MNNNLLFVGGALFLWFLSNRKPERESVKATDMEWYKALLSEYHPDAPDDEQKMEGGLKDRMKNPIITVQQHTSNRQKFPYVSVAADLALRGAAVEYGTRIYFGSYPDYVFRLVDTGSHFRGPQKKIRKPGYEPFDIATNYGSKLGFAGKETVYRIDRNDTLKKRQNVA